MKASLSMDVLGFGGKVSKWGIQLEQFDTPTALGLTSTLELFPTTLGLITPVEIFSTALQTNHFRANSATSSCHNSKNRELCPLQRFYTPGDEISFTRRVSDFDSTWSKSRSRWPCEGGGAAKFGAAPDARWPICAKLGRSARSGSSLAVSRHPAMAAELMNEASR